MCHPNLKDLNEQHFYLGANGKMSLFIEISGDPETVFVFNKENLY